MRSGDRRIRWALWCIAAAAPVVPAIGEDVPPGEFRSGNNDEHNVYPVPTELPGELLGEQTSTFEFVGEPDDDGSAPFSRGTFTSRVHRDATTGGLIFVYLLDQTSNAGINDLESVRIASFGTFATDSYFSSMDHSVSRSPNGQTLRYSFNIEDVEGVFLVRTDAQQFSANGTFFVEMDFEPARGERSRTFAAFAPVPEPGTTGLAAAGAGALLLRRRRRPGTAAVD